jgi:hypothetical protein
MDDLKCDYFKMVALERIDKFYKTDFAEGIQSLTMSDSSSEGGRKDSRSLVVYLQKELGGRSIGEHILSCETELEGGKYKLRIKFNPRVTND